jgi:hypothetical protein
MALQMIDRDERLSRRKRNRLRGGKPDEHTTDKPRARRGCDCVDRVEIDGCVVHGGPHDPVERLNMRARRYLRYNAAKRGVICCLTQYDIGKNPAWPITAALDDRGRRLVTARLNAEDDHPDTLRAGTASRDRSRSICLPRISRL